MRALELEDISFRSAGEDDLEEMIELYNHYVLETPITFDIDPISMEQRREWFTHYDTEGRHRLLVAAGPTESDRILGYAASGVFRAKRAYETSVATSIYLAAGWTGKGIGTRLYQALFEELASEDIHRAYAGITMPNAASVALHEKWL